MQEGDVPLAEPVDWTVHVLLWACIMVASVAFLWRALFPAAPPASPTSPLPEEVRKLRQRVVGTPPPPSAKPASKTPKGAGEMPQDGLHVGESDLRAGMTVTIADPLSELNGRTAKVLRVDGAWVEVDASPLGSVVMPRDKLKREPRMTVAYEVHNTKTRKEVAVHPLCTVEALRQAIAEQNELKTFQFNMIYKGKLVERDTAAGGSAAAIDYFDPEATLRIFINEKALQPGYRAPPPTDPRRTAAVYDSLLKRCEAVEEEALGVKPVPYGVVEATSPQHLTELLRQYEKVLVDFYAPWCGPCRSIAPVFASLAASASGPGGVCFVKVDGDRCPAARARHGVQSFPTFIAFRGGTVLSRMSGANPDGLSSLVRSLQAM